MALTPPFSGQDLAEEVNNKLDKTTGGEINGDVEVNGNLSVSGDVGFDGVIDANDNRIVNVALPQGDTDVANKSYADNSYKKVLTGHMVVEESISSASTLTKTVSLPSGSYRGAAIVRSVQGSGSNAPPSSAIYITFTTNNNNGKVSGTYNKYNFAAWSVSWLGSVTDRRYGSNVVGAFIPSSEFLVIDQFYIDSAKNQIKVVFKNLHTTAALQAHCIIDWEVWY